MILNCASACARSLKLTAIHLVPSLIQIYADASHVMKKNARTLIKSGTLLHAHACAILPVSAILLSLRTQTHASAIVRRSASILSSSTKTSVNACANSLKLTAIQMKSLILLVAHASAISHKNNVKVINSLTQISASVDVKPLKLTALRTPHSTLFSADAYHAMKRIVRTLIKSGILILAPVSARMQPTASSRHSS